LTRQGFDRRTEGYLVMQDGEGEVLFALSTNATPTDETTDRLTLLLDVPRVAPRAMDMALWWPAPSRCRRAWVASSSMTATSR
jgi:hypothetical protein